MHVEAITHPLFRLAPDLPLLTLLILRRDQVFPKVRAEVLHDGAGLGDGVRGFLERGLDADDGGFAERVDRFELGPGEHVLAAGVSAERVVQGELFEEPEDALGAGFLEPEEGLGARHCGSGKWV